MVSGNWEKLNNKLDELVKFCQKHYPNFKDIPEEFVRKLFETYRNTTLIYTNGQIQGFALYQEWPDCLNFIMICLPFGTKKENLKVILSGRYLLPDKKIVWWDEKEMKAKGV